MTRLFALMLALCCSTALGQRQGATFRRWQSNEARASRVASAKLTTDNCTGAAQTTSGSGAITWTRATTATCTKNDATLATVASGGPRCNSTGCLVEPAGTNVSLQSQDFTNAAAWNVSSGGASTAPTRTADTSVAPDGTTTADRIQTSVVTGGTDQSVLFNTGTFTGTAAAWTFSCWIKGTSASGTIPMQFARNTFAASAGQAIISYTTSWARYYVTGTLTAASWLAVIGFAANGAAYATGAGPARDFQLWGCQTELGSFPTSYIPTTATAVTRNADNASFTKPTWLTDTRGCASATVTFPVGFAATGTAARLLGVGATNTLLHISSNYNAVGITDGTNSAFFSKTLLGASSTLRSGWSSAGITITDGTSINTASYDGSIFATSTISLGSAGGSSNFLLGYLSNIKLGNVASGCR